MIKKFLDKVKDYLSTKNSNSGNNQGKDTVMPGELQHRIQYIKQEFKYANDFVSREFEMKSKDKKIKLFLFHIDGLSSRDAVNDFILKPLMYESREAYTDINFEEPDEVYNSIKNRILSFAALQEAKTYEEMLELVLSGDTALLIDGYPVAMILSTRAWEARSIQEPATEAVVRGPHEGFVENMRVNTSLIRRRIKSSKLKFITLKIGEYSQTNVVISYIEGLAKPELVQEIKGRLEKIKIDAILESGYIEELIEDNPYSPFPQLEHTERPDKVTSSLLEGRVAIITDGTPLVLLAPCVFWQLLQASEDYYLNYFFATFTRLLRLFAVIVVLTASGVYVSVTTFHQEMLPTSLLVSIAGQREGVPFPAIVEAFMMEIAFEILREGGVRLPKPVGQAVSIVGALIIGQAAVEAGLVSAAMVIVVSLTGIASFTISNFSLSNTLRLLRFPVMIAASILGFYGIMLVLLFILTHLCALKSFGVPYLSPVAPSHLASMQDVGIRMPWWKMWRRPGFIQQQNIKRQQPMGGDRS